MTIIATPFVILVIFYLYLLTKWSAVKRPLFYLIGTAALLLGFVGLFFEFNKTLAVMKVLTAVAALASFAAVIVACYGAKLPVDKGGK